MILWLTVANIAFIVNIPLRKGGSSLEAFSSWGEIAASVLLKLFINGNKI